MKRYFVMIKGGQFLHIGRDNQMECGHLVDKKNMIVMDYPIDLGKMSICKRCGDYKDFEEVNDELNKAANPEEYEEEVIDERKELRQKIILSVSEDVMNTLKPIATSSEVNFIGDNVETDIILKIDGHLYVLHMVMRPID